MKKIAILILFCFAVITAIFTISSTKPPTCRSMSYQCGSHERWDGANAVLDLDREHQTLVANFRDETTATATYRGLNGRLPPFASASRFGQTVFVALPAPEHDARKQWLGELEKTAQQVVVANMYSYVTVRLTCIARSAEDAQQLHEELQGYLQCPIEMWLIPPWWSRGQVSIEQRHAKQIYERILKADQTDNDPQYQRIVKNLLRACERGDKQEIDLLRKRSQERTKQARQENRDRLKTKLSDKISHELLQWHSEIPPREEFENIAGQNDQHEKQNKLKEFYAKRNAALRRVGELLGQLPFDGEEPAKQDQVELAQQNFGSRNGLLLSLQYVNFVRVDHGLPRLAEWLCGKGCVDLKYELAISIE